MFEVATGGRGYVNCLALEPKPLTGPAYQGSLRLEYALWNQFMMKEDSKYVFCLQYMQKHCKCISGFWLCSSLQRLVPQKAL